MRVLVVEDEPKTAALLSRGLRGAGLSVDTASDGEEALWRATATAYDVVLLDRRLPRLDGLEVCRRLRQSGVRSPVLMLTALGDVAQRIEGLDAGADDYMTKPFALDELLARVRALSRRGPVARLPVLVVGDLRLDAAARSVTRGRTPIGLTIKEFALLETLMRRPGEVVTRLTLLEQAWDAAYENRSNVVDVHIGQLREKIDRPFGRRSLQTVRGAGYRLCAD